MIFFFSKISLTLTNSVKSYRNRQKDQEQPGLISWFKNVEWTLSLLFKQNKSYMSLSNIKSSKKQVHHNKYGALLNRLPLQCLWWWQAWLCTHIQVCQFDVMSSQWPSVPIVNTSGPSCWGSSNANTVLIPPHVCVSGCSTWQEATLLFDLLRATGSSWAADRWGQADPVAALTYKMLELESEGLTSTFMSVRGSFPREVRRFQDLTLFYF